MGQPAVSIGSALLALAAVGAFPGPAHAVLDIEDKGPVLTAGAFALRITNAGIIGNAFFDKGLSFDPSFEIRPGSAYEALNHAELWVGAVNTDGVARVSGGPMLEWRPTLDPSDRVKTWNHGMPGSRRGIDDDGDGLVDEELPNGIDDDGDGEVDEDLGLFAQQTMTAEYVDDRPEALYTTSGNGESHVPLGLSVHQEAYAWSASGYDNIAGLSFHITNHGTTTLRDVRIGLYADLDSRERNDRAGHLDDRIEYETYSRTVLEGLYSLAVAGKCVTGGATAPPCGLSACTTTLSQTVPVLVDGHNRNLPAVAVLPLSHTIDPLAAITPAARYARAPARIAFLNTVFAQGRLPGQGGPPADDRQRYAALSGTFPAAITDEPGDYAVLVSCGPFPTLAPGQSLDFVVALVATLDRDSLQTLLGNAAVLYHGYTLNAVPDSLSAFSTDEWFDGVSGVAGHEVCVEAPPGVTFEWDPHCPEKFGLNSGALPQLTLYKPGQCVWTDADCDVCTGVAGFETRVNWLDPGELPDPPTVRIQPRDHALRMEWDNRPEILSDAGLTGIDGRFAGYRVYKLADWRNRVSLLPPHENWALWRSFGTRTRFGEEPLASITDTTLDFERYLYGRELFPVGRYAVVDSEVRNGFDYAYVVSTVIERDVDDGPGKTRTVRFESPFTPVFQQIAQPHAAARAAAGSVWVVPNPFRGSELWQRPPVIDDPLTRHLDFMGLPRAPCKIRIWTLAGDFVAAIEHDGSNGDGEVPWDLVSRNGQEVESGIYLFSVDSRLGHQVGRFVVIR